MIPKVWNIHEGFARKAVDPRARHNGGYAALSSGYSAWSDVGDLYGLLVDEASV